MVKGILTGYKVKESHVAALSWLTILLIIVLTLWHHPLGGAEIFGDEACYRNEVQYLSEYGLYHALSQGMSLMYTLQVYILSKLCFTSFLVAARLLTIFAFVVSCWLLVKCFERFPGIGAAEKYLGMVFYGALCYRWLMMGLPDIVSAPFIFAGIYLLSGTISLRSIVLAGIILFLGFATKPVAMFALPGIALYLLLRDRKTIGVVPRFGRSALFLISFAVCFALYHIPSIQTYHQIRLEEKGHEYVNGVRIESKESWIDRNVYFTLYNVNHRPTQWHVTWEEVADFQKKHPEIKLHLTPWEYITQHTGIWARNLAYKIFLSMPYDIQRGFFFFLWTMANRFIHNFEVIGFLTSVLIFGFYFLERRFIWQNALLLMIPGLFYLLLSLIIVTPLQGNWLLYVYPLMALPIARHLVKYVNILLILALQVVLVLTY